MFHVSQLFQAVGATSMISELPPHRSEEYKLLIEPEKVLALRTTAAKGAKLEVLIQWKNMSPVEATWEPFELIQG